MKLKLLLPLLVAALVAFVAVPAMACGGAHTSNDTITASADADAPAATADEEAPAAEAEAESAASDCPCQHAQQAEAEQAEESDTELTDTAPADSGVTCPHAVETAAADDDNS